MQRTVVSYAVRRAAQFAALCAIGVGALIALPAAGGVAYAATPTINCDQASTGHGRWDRGQDDGDWQTCQRLVGTAACVWDNKNGTYTIALGYENPTSSNLYASAPDSRGRGGTNNALQANEGTASNPDHITTFSPGTSVTAFTSTWTPTRRDPDITWNLMGHMYEFSTTSEPACSTKPVPIMGNGLAVGLGIGLLLCAFVGLNRRQLARLRKAVWVRGVA